MPPSGNELTAKNQFHCSSSIEVLSLTTYPGGEKMTMKDAYLLKMDLDRIDEEYFVDATFIVTEDTENIRVTTYEEILREELNQPIEIQAKVLAAEPLRK